jgi:hypothetical protein
VTIATVVFLAILFRAAPFGHWDALAMFNGRALEMFRSPQQWRHVFDEFPHGDYPLSLSILIFSGWTAVGRDAQMVPYLISVAFMFAGAVAVGIGLAAWKNAAWGLLGTILVLCSTGYLEFTSWEGADVPTGAFFAAGLGLFVLAYRHGASRGPLLALAGACVSFAGWMKNEGSPLLIGLILGLPLAGILARKVKEGFLHAAWLLAGGAPVMALLRYYHSVAPPSDIISFVADPAAHQKVVDGHRWSLIASHYFEAWWRAPGGALPLILVPLICLWFAGIKMERELRLPVIAGGFGLLTVAASHWFAYVVTQYPLQWHVETSVDRLVVQLTPSVVFLLLLLVRSDFLAPRVHVSRGSR